VNPTEKKVADPPLPKPPRHLKAATRRWWASVVEDFVLEEHHLRLLTLAGEAWDRCAQARAILNREGLTYTDRFNNVKARPEVAIERDSRLAFAKLLRELALDVAAPEDSRPPVIGGGKGRPLQCRA
jgi:phage terminase small subunit